MAIACWLFGLWLDCWERSWDFRGAGAQDASGDGVALEEVVARDQLIANQESLLNTYRCLFDIDTHAVPGGCLDGNPAGGPTEPQPFEGTPTLSDVLVRDDLIGRQESLLNTYRCLFDVDTQLVPGRCYGSRTEGAYSYSVDFEPSTRGVTDDTVRLGALTQAAVYAGFEDGIRARLTRANRNSELPGGRSVELVRLVDDDSDMQSNYLGAQGLVENDEVFGILSTSTLLLPQTTDYLAENQVPFIGWGFMPGYCAPNDWGFGFNGCLSGHAFGVQGADPLVSHRNIWFDYFGTEDISVGVFNSDDNPGRTGAAMHESLWGDKLVFNEFVPPERTGGIADPTQFVNLVLEADPDVVLLSTDFVGAIALKAAIAASGWDGPVADFLTYLPGLPQVSPDLGQALEGGFTVTQMPPLDRSESAIQQLLADLRVISAYPNFGALVGYWSADLMVQLLAAAGEDLNTATFYQAANINGFESSRQVGGLGQVKFPVDHVLAPDCASLVKLVNGEYEVVRPMTCYGDPER